MKTSNFSRYCLFGFLAAWAPLGAGAAALMTQGTLVSTFLGDGGAARMITNDFTGLLENGRARIVLRGRAPDRAVESIDYYYDGANCFTTRRLNPAAADTLRPARAEQGGEARARLEPAGSKAEAKARKALRLNNAILNVNGGPIPDYDPGLTAIWLCLGGGWYYSTAEKGTASPIFPVGESYAVGVGLQHSGVKVSARWRTDAKEPRFLQEMTEYQPGFFYRIKDSRPEREPWPAGTTGNLTNATYEVLSWQRIGGVDVPEEFMARKFLPVAAGEEPGASGLSFPLRSVFNGVITNVAMVSTNLAPGMELTSDTRVIDNRLALDRIGSMAGLAYFPANGKMLSVEELKSTPQYAHRLGQLQPVASLNARASIYIIFLALLAAPLLLRTRTTRGNATI
jgi:hypothetical protein